jgi:hypothetical protein
MSSKLIKYGALLAALTLSTTAFAQSNQPPSTEAPGNQPGKMEMQEGQMPMHHRHHHRHHHHHMGMSHRMSTSPAAGGSGQGDAAPNK